MKIYWLILLVAFSCQSNKHAPPVTAIPPAPVEKQVVALQPFKGADKRIVDWLTAGIPAALQVRLVVLEPAELPAAAWYRPRVRYIADSLLVFLDKKAAGKYSRVIGYTDKDISTRKGDIANWGVLGLGSCPGRSCVISGFRAGKNKVGETQLKARMITLALHELGHTWGLQHCADRACLMKDAQGKMNRDDANTYCKKCRNYLNRMGL